MKAAFNPKQPFELPLLLPSQVPMQEWESARVLKACVRSRAALGALNEAAATLPNPDVMLSSLVLLESQASSEIENIVTTADALFEAQQDASRADAPTKETLAYRSSLYHGLQAIKQRPLSTRLIEEICSLTKGIDMQVRRVPGTQLSNARTGETIYTPPQGEALLRDKLANWEWFCHVDANDPRSEDERFVATLDPLVRMAVLHYQFEAIHPFLDGNGRTGRVINLLFLVQQGLLGQPVLYLSRYILQHRTRYYELLLAVSQEGSAEAWQEWIVYMLDAVHETALWTLAKIKAIHRLMEETQRRVEAHTKLGKQKDLITLLFKLPYCRIADIVDADIAKRQTAAVYLQTLAQAGLLSTQERGRDKLFLNHRLIALLKSESNDFEETNTLASNTQLH
ncbi:MAG: Fic family protein [Burkholderiales bacterium]|nr:MAG: Fic family protein [Burkholderiales bacterium]